MAKIPTFFLQITLISSLFIVSCAEDSKKGRALEKTDASIETTEDKAEISSEVLELPKDSNIGTVELTNESGQVDKTLVDQEIGIQKEEKLSEKIRKKVNEKPTLSSQSTQKLKVQEPTLVNQKDKEFILKKESVVVDQEQEDPSTPEVIEIVEQVAAVKPDHSVWDRFLKLHVSSAGVVNYKGILANKPELNAYCKNLADHPIKEDWSRNEKMAYWINAYNAFTIKLIIDNYPVAKIIDLEGGKPWDKKWIKLGAKIYSLNQIENDILRPVYKEPRIHFAVNCAAKSCPPLLNRAWTAANLESNFEKQSKAFINNVKYNQISDGAANLSKIFDWYGEDFGDLRSYINKYSSQKIGDGDEIKFMEYDWRLND